MTTERKGKYANSKKYVRKTLPDTPKPEWLVDHFLQRGATYMLSAPTATGKTFFGLRLAGAVHNGSDFFGRHVKKGHVVYFYTERFEISLKSRIDALEQLGLPWGDPGPELFVEPFDFMDENDLDSIAEAIGPCDLIIIDTLGNSMGAASPMEFAAMRTLALNIKKVAKLCGNATALIMHHDHKQQRAKNGYPMTTQYIGSSALNNTFDGYYAMTKNAKTGIIDIRPSEQMNGAENFSASGIIKSVEVDGWETGAFVAADRKIVLESMPESKPNKHQADLLDTLKSSQGTQVTTKALAEATGIEPRYIGRYMNPLIASGQVTEVSLPRNSKAYMLASPGDPTSEYSAPHDPQKPLAEYPADDDDFPWESAEEYDRRTHEQERRRLPLRERAKLIFTDNPITHHSVVVDEFNGREGDADRILNDLQAEGFLVQLADGYWQRADTVTIAT